MWIPRPAQVEDVAFSPWRPNSWVMVVAGAALLGLIAGAAVTLFQGRGPVNQYEYHLWRWQADTLLDNVFARIGIGPDPNATEGEAALRNYFRLTSQLRAALDAEQVDEPRVAALTNERATWENDVERYVEGLIDEAVASAGLQRQLPLFHGIKQTWPPVDFELTTPPRLLVRSPRDTIRRAGDILLKNDLSFEDVERIERETTNDKRVSLVVTIGGLAAYPAIVSADRQYDGWLDTTAHEWVHHYLAFYPLGETWGDGGDAETLNETTANIAGREIANLIRNAHPLKLPPGEDGSRPAGSCKPEQPIDFNKEMRELRLNVDRLLAENKVPEAEQLMEERRQFMEKNCIFIRKLNQAYFAFYGTYADGAASSNPVGPKIERVWELTQDVGLFLGVMREIASTPDLDRAVARLESLAR